MHSNHYNGFKSQHHENKMSLQPETATRWLNNKITSSIGAYLCSGLLALISAICFVFFCWYLSEFVALWLTDNILHHNKLIYALLFLTGRYLFAHFASLVNYNTAKKIVSDIKRELYPTLLNDNRLDATESTILLTKVADDLKHYFSSFIPNAIATAIVSLCLLIVAFYIEKWVGVVLLISIIVIPVQMIIIGIGTETMHRKHINLFMRYSAVFYNRLQTVSEIVNLDNFDRQYRFLDKKGKELNKATANVMRIAFLSSTILELFVTLSIAAVAIYLGMSLLGIMPGKSYNIGYSFHNALFLLTIVPYFYFYLRRFVSAYHDKNRAIAAAKIIMPLLQQDTPSTTESTLVQFDNFEIKNLSYSYPNTNAKALNDINISFPEKGLVLIKGISGSGKSTLLKICSGNLLAENGLSANRKDNIWSYIWLKDNSSYMNQFPFIFDGTLHYNVFLNSNSDMPIPDFLEKIVNKKESGWQTFLSNNGKELSGGEKQLVTFARLMAHPKPIVILDEPTANLDSGSIDILMPHIEELAANKLVIVASHEPAFERIACKIVELNWGEQVNS